MFILEFTSVQKDGTVEDIVGCNHFKVGEKYITANGESHTLGSRIFRQTCTSDGIYQEYRNSCWEDVSLTEKEMELLCEIDPKTYNKSFKVYYITVYTSPNKTDEISYIVSPSSLGMSGYESCCVKDTNKNILRKYGYTSKK